MAFEALEIKSLPEKIETEDLVLRKQVSGTGGEVFALVDRNRAHLRTFMPWVLSTASAADSETFVQKCLKQWDEKTCFDYGVFLKATNARIGNCAAHSLDWAHHRAELGYWIDADHQGRGLAGQIVRGLETALFTIGFHRIEIRCAATNERSARLASAQGYRLEGRLREEAIENGEFRDTLIFGKLRAEWETSA